MDKIGNRYLVERQLLPMSDGVLCCGKDVLLNRNVYIYLVSLDEAGPTRDSVGTIGRASRLTDERFMHILDVRPYQNDVAAVLRDSEGGPLLHLLHHHKFSSMEIISLVYRLGKGMQEAMEDSILGYSVTVDNIWYDGERLRVINYWSEGERSRRGALGLCHLLYQLCVRTELLPQTENALEHGLRLALRDVPSHEMERIVKAACRVFREQDSLATFLVCLYDTLSESEYFMEADSVDNAPHKHELTEFVSSTPSAGKERRGSNDDTDTHDTQPHVPVARRTAMGGNERVEQRKPAANMSSTKGAEQAADSRKTGVHQSEHHKKKIAAAWQPPANAGKHRRGKGKAVVVAGAILCFAFFVGFLWNWASQPSDWSGKKSQTSAANDKVSSAPSPAASPSAASDSAAASADPDSSAEAVSPSPVVPADPSSIPDLNGLNRAAAEKLALDSGLHYHFFLESSDQPEGTVIKQEPAAGTPAAKGDAVTFWVSKGK